MTATTANPLELLDRMAADPAFYRSCYSLEVSGEVKRYADVSEPWQEQDAVPMDPAWLRCVGLTTNEPKFMRSWLERPRGASKTSDLAMMACWGLRFAPRRVKFIWASGDADQARLGIEAMRTASELNPWLGLEIQRNVVRNPATGSELAAITSDAASGFGILADAILVDEIGNWPETENAKRLWQMLISTAPKKKNCLFEVITNAGRADGQVWSIREQIRQAPNWYFHQLMETPAWMTPAALDEQRRLLPPHQYDRLYGNVWTSGTDSGLDPRKVEGSCQLTGPQLGRRPEYDAYFAAVDLGWNNDRTGLAVVAVRFEQREISLVHATAWNPQDYGGTLPIDDVETEIEWLHHQFQFDRVSFDPRETVGLSQRLSRQGVPCATLNLSSGMQDQMAKCLLKSFNQGMVKIFRHTELIRDLLSLEIVDRSLGLKVEAPRSASNQHCDLGIAFVYANYRAHVALEDYLIPEPTPEVLTA